MQCAYLRDRISQLCPITVVPSRVIQLVASRVPATDFCALLVLCGSRSFFEQLSWRHFLIQRYKSSSCGILDQML